MSVRNKVLKALLPLGLSFLLVAGCFMLPLNSGILADARLKQASSSLSSSVFKGNAIKNRAMEREDYIPFIGSSEWRRFDAFHPSILAEKYDRAYRPFLLGTAGTQSLTHFLSIHSMGESVEGKRAVFIISPQWFQKDGVDEASFEEFFSPIHIYDWLCDETTEPVYRTYFARRALSFRFVRKNDFCNEVFERLAEGKSLTPLQLKRCQNRLRWLQAEDRFFGGIFADDNRRRIRSEARELPDDYDIRALDKLAYRAGEESTRNNIFNIKNTFYNWRIKPKLKSFKGGQRKLSYDESPEYGDMQLVLNEFARRRMEILFIIPPVNARWAEYTGLSMDMYFRFAEKMKTQLREQGFFRILDLSRKGDTAYFMEDTIHLGWRGWVAADKFIEPFLRKKGMPSNYRIDPYYCSEEWAKKVADNPSK
jgi:D-alanine transfer protein